jgi:arylsulfatase
MDIVPTFLALAGFSHPNATPSHPRATAPYHGRQVYPVRGRSWVDYLRDGRRSNGATRRNGNGDVPTHGHRKNDHLNCQPNDDTALNDWSNDVEAIYGPQDTVVAWEHFGKAALRLGRWKIVNMPVEHPTGTGKWQLYDMYSDQGETIDLAKHMPDKVAELVHEYEKWAQETGAPLKRVKDADGM